MTILAAALSILIGLALGLLGGGGSILTTPLLVYVAGFDAKQAITASLFVVGVTSVVALVSHARAGRVQWRTGLIFGAAGMVGAFAGGQVGQLLPGVVLLAAFSVMMAVTAVAMIRGRRSVSAAHHGGLPVFRILLDGLVVGLVTGLVGAGGGFLVVPALALLGGLAMPQAVATSLLVIAMKSFAGFFGYLLTFGGDSVVSINPETEVNWTITLIVTAGATVGAIIGSRVAGRIHPDTLRKGFGWFVLVMAVLILAQQLGATVTDYADDGPLQLGAVVLAGIAVVGIVAGAIRWATRPPAAAPPDTDESDSVSRTATRRETP